MSCIYIIDGKPFNEESLLKKFNSPFDRQQKAIEWLKTNTNASDKDFLPIVNGLLSNDSLGRMLDDGKLVFSNLAPESVIYHEAFHRIFNFFATDEQRLNLIKDFKNSKNYKNRLAELHSIYNSEKRIAVRGKILSEEDLIEEALAEEFQEFKLGKQINNKTKEGIFSKILNFIKDLLSLNKKLENNSYRQQFYQQIVDGQFSSSSKLRDRIEQYKDSLFEDIKGLTVDNVIDTVDSINAKFIENAIESGKIYDIIDGKNVDYENLFSDAFWQVVEELDVINPKLGDNVSLSLNQLQQRHQLMLKNFNILTDDVEELEDKLFSDEKTKDTEFNKNSVEFDPKASMKKAAKLILSALTTSDINSIGLSSVVPYREVNNILLRNLSNVPTDFEEFLYTINNLSNKFPYLTKLHSILSNQESNTRLVGDFIDSFSNSFVNYNLIDEVNGNLRVLSASDAMIKNNIISDWKLNLQNNINSNPNLIQELLTMNVGTKSATKFYALLGIQGIGLDYQSKKEALTIQKVLKTIKDLNPNDLLTIFDAKDKKFVVEKGHNLSYIFSDIALNSYKDKDDIDVMIFNIDNKPIYPVTQYNYLSMTLGWMNYYRGKFNNEKSLQDQFGELNLEGYLQSKMPHLFNVQTINSTYLKGFINREETFKYNLFLGAKIGKERLDFKTATSSDYYSTAIRIFAQNKEIFSLTQGDRQIFPSFKIPNEFRDISSMADAYIGYIKDEVNKFKLIEKNNSIIAGMELDFTKTLIDPEIYNIKTAFKNVDNLDEFLEKERTSIENSLKTFVQKNKAHYLKILKEDLELNINKLFDAKEIREYGSFENLVENWFINQYMGNIEQFKLFYGDISLFGNYSNLWKRLNTPTSTGTPGNTSEYLLDHLNDEDDKFAIEDFNYRIARENAGVHKSTIKEQFLLDKITESNVFSNIEETTKEYYKKVFSVFNWEALYKKNQKIVDKFPGNTPLEKLINYKVSQDVAPYKKIEEGDGFSYINLYEWKRIMKTWKLWTDKHDTLFEREFEVLKITLNTELSLNEKTQKINELFNSNSLNVEDYFNKHEQASLLKPQYSGIVYDRPLTDYMELNSSERFNTYGIRKTSFMPLLPSVIFNTDLEKMHHKMLKSGTGVIFFSSAAKVGAVKKEKMHNPDEIASNSENQFEDNNSTYLSYQYLKNQLYIKSEEKKSIIDATQSRKNMIADKYHKKVPFDFIFKNSGENFRDIAKKWNSLSEEEKLNSSESHKVVEDYLKTLNNILDRNAKLFLSEMDITSLSDKFDEFDLKNIKTILKILKKQARDRNNTLDLLDSFQYMIDKGSTLFNVFPNPTKLQSIMTSLITSNVLKFKRIGSDYAQVSPVMWESTPRIEDSKTNSNLLKFYSNELSPSEIMIPAPQDLLKKLEKAISNPKEHKEIAKYYNEIKGDYPDGFNIKLLTDLLNKLIEVGYLDSEVTFKGLRIPNQELSSNEVVKVKKFLLPTMSKMVVINVEMVAKTGSDFDIDKLNIYFKYLDKSLKTIKYTEEMDEESIKNRFKQHSQERIQDLIDNVLDKDVSTISKEISNIYQSMSSLKKEFKEDLEDYQELREKSSELYDQYKEKINEILDNIKSDFINFNNTENAANLSLDEFDLNILDKVKSIKGLQSFLFYLKSKKEDGLGNGLIILRTIKNDLNNKLNQKYESLPKNKDPFKNQEFRELHETYTASKIKIDNYIKENDFSYKTVLAIIDQLDKIFESVQEYKQQLDVNNKTKNELNEKIHEGFFDKLKDLKLKKELWQNMELEFFKKLPLEFQNSPSALYNRLGELEEKLILNETNLANLLHPIGDGDLKDFLINQIEPTQSKEDRFSVKETKSLHESLHPFNNLSKKLDLKEAEIGIGQLATQLTHHAIGKDLVLFQEFLSERHKQVIPTELKFEGLGLNYDLDDYFTSDLENIFQLLSGHLTTQVDAAKDPYAVYLNIKNSTIPVISYLFRRGVSKDIVYKFLTQPKVLDYILKLSNYQSLSYKYSNNKIYSTTFSPSKMAFKKIFGMKVRDKLKFDFSNLKSMSLSDLNSKFEDLDFQKNAVTYFISLAEQAKIFNNMKKLMASDTSYHKSISSYQELLALKKDVEQSGMFGNDLDVYLNNGFIKPFNQAAKLYYYPWKSLFLSTRDFASYIGNYLDIYSSAIADSLNIPIQDGERRSKINNSMEKQFLAYVQDNFGEPISINVPSALTYIKNNYKGIKIGKLYSIMLNYGLNEKQDIIQSKVKTFTPFEINNYILLFRKLARIKSINISKNESVTGEELVKNMYLQHLKQTKNDFSPFAIDTLIPGNIKMQVLSNLLNQFLVRENKSFGDIFESFTKQFQLSNEQYIGYGKFKGLLGKVSIEDEQALIKTTIQDEFGNNYQSKSLAYYSDLKASASTTKDFEEEDKEESLDISDFLTTKLEELEKLKKENSIPIITKNSIKNIYFFDGASKNTVNGSNAYLNEDILDFEKGIVYIKTPTIILDGVTRDSKKLKIGTYENENGNRIVTINPANVYKNLKRNTTDQEIIEQPINKEIKPNEVKGIEINSYQTGLGNSLTNVHYAKNGKSEFDIIPSDKSLKLTQAAKNKWGESVEAWYKSNNAQTKGIAEGVEGDKYDMNLMIGLITDKLIQYPNLVQQINQNGGLAFLQKSTHNMGSGRWSSKNSKNMFMNSLIQAYKNVNQPTEITPKIDSSKKIEVKSFKTGKGSVYTYLPDGRIERFKTVEGKKYPAQDLIVFVKFKNSEQEQNFLEGVQDRERSGTKVYVIDKQGNKYSKNSDIKGKEVFLALVETKTNKVIDTVATKQEPTIGYNTYDESRYVENGESMRSMHIGNKVTEISTQEQQIVEENAPEGLPSIKRTNKNCE